VCPPAQGMRCLWELKSLSLVTGDFVDRGPNSLGVVYLLSCLVLLKPKYVFLTRGNHETEAVFARYGFKKEVSLFGVCCTCL
jgi:hypothetical protein